MPRHETLTVSEKQVSQLTDGDVTHITLQPLHGEIFITGSAGAVPPAIGAAGWFRILPGVPLVNEALSGLFPGIAGANRVWAYSPNDSVSVVVSHA